MTAPDCTDHGSLILEYIRGDLNESDGLRAEAHLCECPVCRAWINQEFSGPRFALVENAVADGIDAMSLPTRRQRFGWVAAAAAIVVVAGGLALLQPSHRTTPMAVDQQSRDVANKIVTFDFEGGELTASEVSIEEKAVTAEVGEADALFTDDLEAGGTGSWTIHT